MRLPWELHAASGLHLAPFRAYDAGLGRWISPDPIAENGGINLYAYCGGDPMACVDPLGLWDFQDSANFAAGWGDTLTTIPFTNYSLSREFREANPDIFGKNGGVDKCSSAYKGGEAAGIANSLALGGKGFGNLASRIGNQSARSRLYEIGQRTLTGGQYSKYRSIADPVRRGIAMVRDGASGAPSVLGILSQAWRTIGTGLTPQARAALGDIAAGFGGALLGGTGLWNKANSDCP